MHCSNPLPVEGAFLYAISGFSAHLRCVSQPSAGAMDEYLWRQFR